MDGREGSGDLRPAAVLGVCVMVGLILGGWLLGGQIKATRLADRYVTVKGLVERTVKSDSAVWPVSFKEAGNDLPQVFAKSEEDKNAVLKFFAAQGGARWGRYGRRTRGCFLFQLRMAGIAGVEVRTGRVVEVVPVRIRAS